MTATMTSEQIGEQISQLDRRIRALDDRLRVNIDLDKGLELSRERVTLDEYRSRLHRQLIEAQEQEARATRETERAARETEAKSFADDFIQATSERAETLNTLAAQLQPDADKDAERRETVTKLRDQYWWAFYRLHGRYPEGLGEGLQPAQMTAEAEIVAFCLVLLDNYKTGNGIGMREILIALRATGM